MSLGLTPYARDPELPARAGEPTLCPPGGEVILELVGKHLSRPRGPQPLGAELVYARYKPGASITATYRIELTEDTSELVTYKRYHADKLRGQDQRWRAPAPSAEEIPLEPSAVLLDGHAHLFLPAHDRVLRGLGEVLDVARLAKLIDRSGQLAPWVVRRRPSEARLQRYKPERRAVLRLELALRGEDGARKRTRRGLRVLFPPVAARVAQARRSLADLGPAALGELVPSLVAHDAPRGLLYEEWLDGVPCGREELEIATEAGAALARLHRIPAPTEDCTRAPGRAPDLAPLLAIDAELAGLVPVLASLPASGRRAWIHGDFHADQLLRRGRGAGLALLDLDELAVGDPLVDLASWAADAVALGRARDLTQAVEPLLEGYLGAGGGVVERELLPAWVARELCARAAASLRRLERGAVERARALLRAARAIGAGERVVEELGHG